ncbi:MAG: HIT family protein [Nanoarchaeota archaeon]
MTCRFCDIIQGKELDYPVWEDEMFIVLLNIERINPGSVMIIPKVHVDYLFDLDDTLYADLFFIARRVEKALKSVTNAKRIGLAVSGFEIPHAHLHVLPLHGSNELDATRFIPAGKEELLEMQEKLRMQLNEVMG